MLEEVLETKDCGYHFLNMLSKNYFLIVKEEGGQSPQETNEREIDREEFS